MRIHREASSPRFMAAVVALLFLAVCAYIGAGLFEKLSPDMLTVRAELFSLTESTRLSGIALRREQTILSQGSMLVSPEDNRKYPAGELLCVFKDESSIESPASGIFYQQTDGFEYLSPDMLSPFSSDGFSQIMDMSPDKERHCIGRLVLDDVWYYAACVTEGNAPRVGSRCRLFFEGIEQSCQALVWAVDEQCVLLRLNLASKELLSLRKCSAELILNEYQGLKIPREALRRDGEGNLYVCVLSSGLVEKRSVDIIYTADDYFLAERRYSADALREGELIIVAGEGVSLGEYS